jgi:hypothetical protein
MPVSVAESAVATRPELTGLLIEEVGVELADSGSSGFEAAERPFGWRFTGWLTSDALSALAEGFGVAFGAAAGIGFAICGRIGCGNGVMETVAGTDAVAVSLTVGIELSCCGAVAGARGAIPRVTGANDGVTGTGTVAFD